MLFLCASFLAFATSAFAATTTRTELRCQTRLGSSIAYEVPTRTSTSTIIKDPLTVEITQAETVTITPHALATFEVVETSVSTINSTVTERFSGSIWTTTLTRFVDRPKTVNWTTYTTTGSTTWNVTRLNLTMPTTEGFQAIDETAPAFSEPTETFVPTESVIDSKPSETPSIAGPDYIGNAQTFYVIKDGKLVEAKLDDLLVAESLQRSATDTAEVRSTDASGREIPPPRTLSDTSMDTTSAVTSATDTASRTATSSSVKSEESDHETGTDDSRSKHFGHDAGKHAPEYTAAFPEVARLPKRDLKMRKPEKRSLEKRYEDTRDYQKAIKGLRGVIMSNTASASVAFPTLVDCEYLRYSPGRWLR